MSLVKSFERLQSGGIWWKSLVAVYIDGDKILVDVRYHLFVRERPPSYHLTTHSTLMAIAIAAKIVVQNHEDGLVPSLSLIFGGQHIWLPIDLLPAIIVTSRRGSDEKISCWLSRKGKLARE
jgi:hypothetical protein